jgi:hypothetical protein
MAREAQAQLGVVVGGPTFEGLVDLSYIRAMINEMMRRRTVGALG